MGYTHYWYIDENIKEFDDIILSQIKEVCNKFNEILDNTTNQKVTIEKDLIMFNGIGEDSHETFFINLPMTKGNDYIQRHSKDKNKIFGFCKTACKPYDIVVCSVLLILKKHLKNKIFVSSDGEFKDWKPARDIINSFFKFEIIKEDLFYEEKKNETNN